MIIKRISFTAFIFLLCTSFLSSQTLVDLVKKEKERRAKIQGKKGLVVTNADLVKLKKKPALSVPKVETEESETPGQQTSSPQSPPAEEAQSPNIEEAEKKDIEGVKNLEEKWKKANEYVDLLNLKMNALRLEYSSMDDSKNRESIQKEISETYLKLQNAQKEAEEAKKEFDQAKAKK